jgi:hypothetical protein
MRLAAQYGQGWVTLGRSLDEDRSCFDVVASQMARLDETLSGLERSPKDLERVLLNGLSTERPLVSLGAFVDWAGRYQELGMTELVVHWPEPNSIFEADVSVFEQIAVEGLSQL